MEMILSLHEETLPLGDGREVLIKICQDQAEVLHEGIKIGNIEWDLHVSEQGYNHPWIIHLGLDRQPGFLRCGIGTKVFQLINQYIGKPIFTDPAAGKQNDGSHLIDGGLDFALSMQKKGLAHISNSFSRCDSLHDD